MFTEGRYGFEIVSIKQQNNNNNNKTKQTNKKQQLQTLIQNPVEYYAGTFCENS